MMECRNAWKNKYDFGIFTVRHLRHLGIGISATFQYGTAGHVLVRYFPAMFISNILAILYYLIGIIKLIPCDLQHTRVKPLGIVFCLAVLLL